MLNSCAQIWDKVREKNPLVHCITNYVTVNDVANVLLASGASPAMVEHPGEAADFVKLASCLYLNLGTLTSGQEQAMLAAAKNAAEHDIPVVVDPVACGVIPQRAALLEKIIRNGRVDIIKGNGAEIKSLTGAESLARGVDSLESGKIEYFSLKLAQDKQCIVAATGKIDTVSDQQKSAFVNNETPLFAHITGAGCMVGAVVAACVAVNREDPWLATISALCAFTLAGEKTAKLSGYKPGTFHKLLFDQLFQLTGEDIRREGKIQWP